MKTVIEQHCETGEQVTLRICNESIQIWLCPLQPVGLTWEFRSRKSCEIKQTHLKNGSASKW